MNALNNESPTKPDQATSANDTTCPSEPTSNQNTPASCAKAKPSQKNFKFYFKCNVAKVTSETHTTTSNQPNLNEPPNNWFKKISKTAGAIHNNDSENRFFIFGLFFLNVPKSATGRDGKNPGLITI